MSPEDDVLQQKRVELEGLRRTEQLEARKAELESQAAPSEPVGAIERYAQQQLGMIDAAATMATGAAATPFAGIAGIAAELAPGGQTGAEAVRGFQEKYTWQPKTEYGQEYTGMLAEGGAVIERGVDWLATSVSDNPLVQTTIKTALLGLPEAAGIKTGVLRYAKTSKQLQAMERVADEMGVNLEAGSLPEDLARASRKLAVAKKGEGVMNLQKQLRAERAKIKAIRDARYEQARETRATLRPKSVEELEFDVRLAVSDYGIDGLPRAKNAMNDIANLSRKSALGERVSVEEVFALRRKVNSYKPGVSDEATTGALGRMVSEMDKYTDDLMYKDLIDGDPTAVANWRKAIEKHREYKVKFDDNKIIRSIVNDELTPEQVKNVIIGGGKVKAGSATVVKRIKNILGEDHPAIDGLRQEMLLPIVQPLFEAKPNFRQFTKNVNDLIINNNSMVKELSPKSLKPLLDLDKIAKAAIRTGAAPGFEIDMAEAMSRVLFGHQIAKAALKVSLATKLIKVMQGTGKSERRALLAELTGIDPSKALIPKSSVYGGAIIADQISGAIEDEMKKKDPEIPSIPKTPLPEL